MSSAALIPSGFFYQAVNVARQKLSKRDREGIYKPLKGQKQIRTIRLLPGKPDDVITVELVRGKLAKAKGTYEALSYTWGDPDATETILCNGLPFEVTANAVAFLRRLRHAETERLLWMDAICINQADLREREEQVKIMHQIYKSARRVLAWLGEEQDDSDIAMDYASQLDTARLLNEWYEGRTLLLRTGKLNTTETKSWICDGMDLEDPKNKELLIAVCQLICRPWIGRIWIQQELAFASDTTICCGSKQIKWEHYLCLIWYLGLPPARLWPEFLMHIGVAGFNPVIKTAMFIQSHRTPWLSKLQVGGLDARLTLLRLIYECWHCKSSDPRDKVYAVLNLATESPTYGEYGAIVPDYSIPWEHLYIKISKVFYKQGLMEYLQLAAPGVPNYRKNQNLPTWVIDWSNWFHHPFDKPYPWRAGLPPVGRGLPPVRFRIVPESETWAYPRPFCLDGFGNVHPIQAESMEVPIFMLDEIVYASRFVDPSSQGWAERVSDVCSIDDENQQYLRTLKSEYIDGESVFDSYKRTRIGNWDHASAEASLAYCQRGYEAWRAWIETGGIGEAPVYNQALQVMRMDWMFRLCVTASGYLCLASQTTRIGDHVAVVAGSYYPMTIRKKCTSEGNPTPYFTLVASCYVHGMMHSQAWKLLEMVQAHAGDVDLTAADLTDRWHKGVDGALHENYSRILSTLGAKTISLV